MKKRLRKKRSSFFKKIHSSKGKMGVSLIIFFLAVSVALFFTGGFFNERKNPYITPTPIQYTNSNSSAQCCDSGDGDACKPSTEKKVTYNGSEYGLLKSDVQFEEENFHLKDTGEKTSDNSPIILNSSNEYKLPDYYYLPPYNVPPDFECSDTTHDAIFKSSRKPGMNSDDIKKLCVSIPNDEILYVCKKNCFIAPQNSPSQKFYYYGDRSSRYDVYFLLSDIPTPGIPDVIKNCDKSAILPSGDPQQLIAPTISGSGQNLQLNTFKVIDATASGAIPWMSPFCKPAIYLYPKEKTNLSVSIQPQGKLTLTIPSYPKDGWNVTAYPNGNIISDNALYPYLYYEAEIPDSSYQKPTEGYVVEKKDLKNTLESFLTKLGLNDRERTEFVTYWVKVLPSSPYYFLGAIPQKTLDTISPLSVSKKPDTIIRVTLYFQALDKKERVKNPSITTPKRDGFTVVEWGGIFKRDKDHPFSCFM